MVQGEGSALLLMFQPAKPPAVEVTNQKRVQHVRTTKDIIPFLHHCLFCLPFAWLRIEFCFFGLVDAQARADEIEALKKAKLTLAGD